MILKVLYLGPLLFFVNSFVIGLLTAGYSPKTQAISSLVLGKLGWLQTLNFAVCGLLTLALTYHIWHGTSSYKNTSYIVAGALVFGLSLVLLAIFPTDPAGQKTLVGQIHGAIFILTVLIQAGLQLSFAIANAPSVVSWYLLGSGLITALGLPAMMLFPDYRGIAQRLLVGAIVVWVTLATSQVEP